MVKEKKIDKLKRHVKNHQTAYTAVIVGTASAGITWLIMRKHAGIRGVPGYGIRGVPDVTASAVTVNPLLFFSRQANNITSVVHRNNQGPPSYMVECLEDNMTWLSQRVAAAAKGVPNSVMSGHLNGKFPDIDGEHFRRIGVAVA